MRKKLIAFGITIAALGACASVFTLIFEVVEDEKYFPPSREAQLNEYLALDRWLASEGHNVRVVSSANVETLKTAPEGTLLIQTDLFDWNKEVSVYLESWVEKGGNLIICLNYYRNWNEDELGVFLDKLGLEAGDPPAERGYNYDDSFPNFSRNIIFKEPAGKNAEEILLTLKDEEGLIRLVQLLKGNGKITITGRPMFMTSESLKTEANARLSWYLLAQNDDVFFVRGEGHPEGLIGRIFQKGNFAIIVISALALIVAGFWSAIPVFGIVRGNEKNRGKALAERFLAEGRFLKQFGALDHYRAVYFREIRRRLMKKENMNLDDKEIISRAASLLTLDEGSALAYNALAEQALSPQAKTKKDFLKSVHIMKTILERL